MGGKEKKIRYLFCAAGDSSWSPLDFSPGLTESSRERLRQRIVNVIQDTKIIVLNILFGFFGKALWLFFVFFNNIIYSIQLLTKL